jgi:hypothetical protein
VRLTVAQGNPFTVGIRLGSACDNMPRDNSMVFMIAGRTCCELAKAIFVAMVPLKLQKSPVRGVSEPKFLGCSSELSRSLKGW